MGLRVSTQMKGWKKSLFKATPISSLAKAHDGCGDKVDTKWKL